MDFPAATTTLYGRDDELDQIALHLNDPDHRLVSLVGPGGIGKTSLGIEAARRYGDRTKDGCVLVDLQAVDQHELVLQRLADALQLSIQNRQSALDQIIQFLRGKETLLYFDNFEQVIEAAPIVTDLLAKSPGTTALVTSRIPLRVTQEWILNVDGLAFPNLTLRPQLPTMRRYNYLSTEPQKSDLICQLNRTCQRSSRSAKSSRVCLSQSK